MAKNKVIDYDATVLDFFTDVFAWLNERVPRDTTEVNDIKNTKEMWNRVFNGYNNKILFAGAVSSYSKRKSESEKLIADFMSFGRGFAIKRGMFQYDNTMFLAVYHMLMAIDEYYMYGGDFDELKIAEKLKRYKVLRAKNAIERAKISMTNPKKLLSTRQR